MPTNALSNVHLRAFDVAPQQMAILDSSGVIVETNKAWEHFAKYDPSLYAERGANYLHLCGDAHHHELEGASRLGQICRGLHDVLAGSSAEFTLEYSHFVGEGERWFVMYIKPLGGDSGGAVISHIDVTSHKRFEQEIARAAYTDALTGLPNRRAFFERAAQMIASAKRHARELNLFYLDLNGFKEINDTLGHDAGDSLLIKVAERFKNQTRESDLLARLGGDEFVCLLEVHPHGYEPSSYAHNGCGGAKRVAERYAACLAAPFRLEGEEVHLDASIGVAQFPRAGSTLRALLKKADSEMYEYKQRNRVRATTREAKLRTQQVSHEDCRPS